jgi:hypothetical protein
MGQYFKFANLDKKEFFSPHDFGELSKLQEFTQNSFSMLAFTLLMADGVQNGGGCGYYNEAQNIGRWANDRVVIAGDYAFPVDEFAKPEPVWNEQKRTWENGPIPEKQNVYHICETWTNVAPEIFADMLLDTMFAKEISRIFLDAYYKKKGNIIFPFMYDFAIDLKNHSYDFGLATDIFRRLFPDDNEYYHMINGYVKHKWSLF